MTRMYEHHDAVLHAVREGVIIVGGDGRLLLANDEARRLLDLPADAEGRHVSRTRASTRTPPSCWPRGGSPPTRCTWSGDRLLAVNQRPTDLHGGPPGSVATLRDTTELRALSGRAEVARERLQAAVRRRCGHRHHAWTWCAPPRSWRRSPSPGSRTSSPSIWPTPCCAARSRRTAGTDTAPHRRPAASATDAPALPGRRA